MSGIPLHNEIHYAAGDEGHVAYQIIGDGPIDIVFIPDWITNLEIQQEEPLVEQFFKRLARFSRLILFDKRGTGLSDPVPLGAIPTFEELMEDVLTVLDAIGSDQAVVFGHGDGGMMAIQFAATHPERATHLILADACARRTRAEDYQQGIPEEVGEKLAAKIIREYGTAKMMLDGAPSCAADPSVLTRRARLERLAMSPGQFAPVYPRTYQVDLRAILPAIHVPTLVLHRRNNRYIHAANGEYLGKHIKNAKFIDLPGEDHMFFSGDSEAMLGEIEMFLTGHIDTQEEDRVLATVLFTDIAQSTETAQQLGDRAWGQLLTRHHQIVRKELDRFRGTEIDTAGDGFFASFDGPARAVRCALAIRDAMAALELQVRYGLHTGECERIAGKIGGMTVHLGARVAAAATPGEVWVSRTLHDLVVGSGLEFSDRGLHHLKGVDGEWRLYAAG